MHIHSNIFKKKIKLDYYKKKNTILPKSRTTNKYFSNNKKFWLTKKEPKIISKVHLFVKKKEKILKLSTKISRASGLRIFFLKLF